MQKLTYDIGVISSWFYPKQGCYKEEITYFASMEQIVSLMDISADCFQDITHTCVHNTLTGYSWWMGRGGRNNKYWHGNGTVEEGCACSIESNLNCTDAHGAHGLCNCDDRNEGDIDAGTLRGFDQLPVMGLYYGDSAFKTSFLHYNLGRLHCNGQKAPFPSQSVFMNQITDFTNQIENLTQEVTQNNNTLTEEIENLNDELTKQLRKSNDKLSNEIHYLLPVGTIIPWVPGPSISSQELQTDHYSGWF